MLFRSPIPSDGIRWIGDDCFKGLIVPVQWIRQCVAMTDVKLVVVDVVEEHIDAAKVIVGDVDFLAKKALSDVFLTQYLSKL